MRESINFAATTTIFASQQPEHTQVFVLYPLRLVDLYFSVSRSLQEISDLIQNLTRLASLASRFSLEGIGGYGSKVRYKQCESVGLYGDMVAMCNKSAVYSENWV